jgi:threonine dehydrogenase-like Zn-dependent dehydrogenase
MRATCWYGAGDVRIADVPEPEIVNPRDAIVRITLTAICGSDLHLYDGFIPTMKRGDILGHEFMGEVVDVGSSVGNLKPGDRVVVPFNIACGKCFFCNSQQWSLCDNSNPTPDVARALYGQTPAGLFGYSHMMGGYAGGQAEYVRVPYADVGPLKLPEGLDDEKALFLSDIFPTGYQAAENCGIEEGDTVAVWGAGPVGQFAIRSALLLGAERVIAIDHRPGRLDLARGNGVKGAHGSVETLNFDDDSVYEALLEMTGGMGPDRCIDAVGLESHGVTPDNIYDLVKVATMTATDRIHALRQIVRCCRKGGTISIAGVYGGFADKFPIGAIFGKGLTIRCGQTHVHKYMKPLLERIERDEIDPSFVISHRVNLDDAPDAYAEFKHNQDECHKVVMRP